MRPSGRESASTVSASLVGSPAGGVSPEDDEAGAAPDAGAGSELGVLAGVDWAEVGVVPASELPGVGLGVAPPVGSPSQTGIEY